MQFASLNQKDNKTVAVYKYSFEYILIEIQYINIKWL